MVYLNTLQNISENLISSIKPTHIQIILILSIIFIIPIVKLDSAFLSYELPKLLVFRILVETLLLLEIYIMWRGDKSIFKYFLNLPQSIKYLSLAIFIFLIINVFFAGNSWTAFWGNYHKNFGLFTLLHLILFSILVSKYVGENREIFLKYTGIFIPIPIWINFASSFGQVFFETIPYSLTHGRAVGEFGQSNFLAGYIILILPIVFLYLKSTKKLRIYTWISILLGIITVFLTGSRSAYILLPATLALCGFLIGPADLRNALYKHKIATLTIGFLCLAGVVLFSPRFQQFGLVDSSRQQIWKSSIHTVQSGIPLHGFGFDNLGYVLPQQLYKDGLRDPIVLDRSHNEILDIVLSFGFVGFLLFLAFHIEFIRNVLNFKKYTIVTISLVGITIFWVRSMVNVNGIVHYILYAFFMGILHSYICGAQKFNNTKSWNLVYLAIPVLVGCIFLNINMIRADIFFRKSFAEEDNTHVQTAISLNPISLEYRKWNIKNQSIDPGNTQIDKLISPFILEQDLNDPALWFYVGLYLKNQGDMAQAREFLAKAYKAEPVNEEYLNVYKKIK